MSKVIGIDLGTVNSCVAVLDGGRPRVLPNRWGSRTTPSFVARRNQELIAGYPAKWQAAKNPRNTVHSFSRFLGGAFDSPEVQLATRLFPFEIVAAPNGDACLKLEGRVYSPPEVLAVLLRDLKMAAQEHIGERVDGAVISVPSSYGFAQCEATCDAANIAGLEVLRIINAGSATALYHGLGHRRRTPARVAVFDLGGGSFDVSLFDLDGGVCQVLATGGDPFLGGIDFDEAIVCWLLEEFRRARQYDLTQNPVALERLRDEAEKAKCLLSTKDKVSITLPYITGDPLKAEHLHTELSRQRAEQMLEPLLKRVFDACDQAFRDSGFWPESLDEVLIAGGQTRSPQVLDYVRRIFWQQPNTSLNRDEVVAMGAAIYAGILSGEVPDAVLLDVNTHAIGIQTRDLVPVEVGTISYSERTFRSFTPIIHRNTTLPTCNTRVFTTTRVNQTTVELDVLENELADYDGVFNFVPYLNRTSTLGTLRLDFPPGPGRDREIEISLAVGVNRVVEVEALDRLTGRGLVSEWKSGPRVLTPPAIIDSFRNKGSRSVSSKDSSRAASTPSDEGPLFFLGVLD